MKKECVQLLIAMTKYSFIGFLLQLIVLNTILGHEIDAQKLSEVYVEVSFSHAGLKSVLEEIEEQSDFYFTVHENKKYLGYSVSIEPGTLSIYQLLLRISAQTNLSFQRINNNISIRETSEPHQAAVLEQTIVSGKVTGENGYPLPGVNILIKGTDSGTVTDIDGNYSLKIPDAKTVLIFSFIGFVTQEVPVRGRTIIDVALVADVQALQEVVVVGYGTQKKADVTGAISSISSEEFSEQPVTRIDQVLQGRAAGVQVTKAGGAPGGEVRIRIRGANSLSGNNDPLYVVDGFVGADFNTINPRDIESIEVLKDASSTAIYGSRGANGVIIITTKSGKAGEMKVDFGLRSYSSGVIRKYNTLNAADFARVVNEREKALTLPGQTYTPVFSEPEIEAFRTSGGTDWQDEIFRQAPGQEYQLSVSGGNKKTNYLISGNYLDQKGIIINSDYKRYSLRVNVGSQLSEKFSVQLNFAGTRRENHNTDGTAKRSSVLAQALAWAPTTPVRDAAGDYVLNDPTSSLFANPVAKANETDDRTERTGANIVGGLRYEFIPGLSLDVQLGLDYLHQQHKRFVDVAASRNVANAGRASNENIIWQNTNTLTYKHIFNNAHQLNVTAVFETQKFTGSGFNVNVHNLTYPDQSYHNISLSESSIVGSDYSSWSLLSLLGRINYSFKDRYLLTATVRRDGSSKFRGSHKYSIFPSVGVGWRLSEEAFMQNSDFIHNLKIRGSWGLTGSQGIHPYGTLSSYVTTIDDAGVVFDGNSGDITSGILLGNPGNPDLRWETTEQIDIGADLELLQGKVGLTVDYFVKNTRDLLMLRSLPGYMGGYSLQSNIGELQNKGWEFALGITPVHLADFQWNSSFNLSLLRNKIVSLGEARDTIPFNNSPNVLIPGYAMNSFWGYHYLGTWKPQQADQAAEYGLVPGDVRYEDVDNNGMINGQDYRILGNGTPRTSLGWNNTLTYKNFSLNIFFQGFFGFDKFNYTYAYGMAGSTDTKEIIFADIKDRYIPGVNETSDIPAFTGSSGNALVQTSRFVEEGDFLRLKNVSLSYSLPKAMLWDIMNVRVFVSATNLLTLTNYKGIDPESNSASVSGLTWDNFGTDVQQGVDYGSYPNAKTYTVGVNFSF